MRTGKGTKLWYPRLSNLSKTASCGADCIIHSHVWVGDRVAIGDRCKIQAFVFIPTGVRIGNDVFIGPHVCFTNDKHPPSQDWQSQPITTVADFVSIGANATILPGITIGEGSKIGAGAVVTKNVPKNAIVYGNPAKIA